MTSNGIPFILIIFGWRIVLDIIYLVKTSESFIMTKERIKKKNEVEHVHSLSAEINKLSDLKNKGLITEEEYNLAKQRLLK